MGNAFTCNEHKWVKIIHPIESHTACAHCSIRQADALRIATLTLEVERLTGENGKLENREYAGMLADLMDIEPHELLSGYTKLREAAQAVVDSKAKKADYFAPEYNELVREINRNIDALTKTLEQGD